MTKLTLEAIAEKHNLKLVLLFGSAVSGRLHAASDKDIAVLFASAEQAKSSMFAVAGELEDVFPGEKIDVAVVNFADPLFLKQIVGDCRLLYGDERTLHELKMYAFTRYHDHKKYLELESEYVKRMIGGKA